MEAVKAGRKRELGQPGEPPRQLHPLPGQGANCPERQWARVVEEGNRCPDGEDLPLGLGRARDGKCVSCNQNTKATSPSLAPERSAAGAVTYAGVCLSPFSSHKKYRAALKKEKRKKRRQELARLRDSGLSQKKEEEEKEAIIEQQQQEEKLLETQRQKLHEEWLLREQKAQEEFRIKKEKEEAARKRQEEQERKLKEEWEEQQRREKEEEAQKLQEKREREEAVQKMLERAENELENAATWQNPEPPTELRIMEKDRANCPFYSKTGACRFGDRCSRKHNFPTSSPTLLIRSMFTTFGMEQCRRDDYDPDASLEYSEEETYQQFLDFYEDVLPEFKNVGKVIQFKVSCNLEPHLRGNVYVQYQSFI
ncbi:zinc finger CCCH-type, RNA binding motif and serine/arginine rich 2 [Phyllostomus discolor]|uniref:Zinc finger CCCH-type, RNA binding motif and serine/arginine rich 2 n=1 Tax=Phyllostomus discolor TaxID=89673 RepID=A0A833Z9R9_9CHIR|nr:zinc finger CCCH-type, RNA binding motif and serine/arginine rich 2 [Phyllostomus discolor]